MNGTASPMPLPFLKAIWPAFIANGAREYVGLNVPSAQITGATFSMNLSGAELAELNKGRDIPDGAFSLRVGVSGAKIYHIKGLPPIQTKDSVVHVSGQRVVYDIPEDGRIETPNGRPISFTNGQLIVTNLRADDPDAEIRFQGAGEVASVLELLDQPPLGYVKAVGFKPNFVNGQVQAAFQIKFPMADDLKFSLFKISGKSRVFDLKSNSLPGGFTINGGAVNFDVSDNRDQRQRRNQSQQRAGFGRVAALFRRPARKAAHASAGRDPQREGARRSWLERQSHREGRSSRRAWPSPCRGTVRRACSWRRTLPIRTCS